MQHLTRLTCLVVLVLVQTAQTAQAADTAVFPVEATNLTEGEAAVIGALMASAYAAVSEGQVLGPPETVEAVQASPNLQTAARALGVGEYITVTAVRMQIKISVSATLHNIHGSQLFSEKMTARSLDDMEEVSDRLAHALDRRTSTEHTMTIDNVTAAEGKAPNRTFIEKVIGARVAVVLPVTTDGALDPAVLAQFDMRMEGRTYFIEFGAGIMLPSDLGDSSSGRRSGIGGLVGDLGASYYLGNAFIAPYVGGGLSPRIVGGSHDGVGLTAWGQAGLMFMRQSSSRFYTELRIGQNLLPMKTDFDYDYATGVETGGDKVYPTEFSLAAGVGW